MKQKEPMNSKKIKKIKNRLLNFLVIFVTIFTLMLCNYVSISLFVFEQFNLHFFYILIIILFALIASIVIALFVKINKIALVWQITIIYSIFTVFSLGATLALFNSYMLQNIEFFLIIVFSSLIGLIFLIIFAIYMKKLEERKLNKELEKFKGRKRQ